MVEQSYQTGLKNLLDTAVLEGTDEGQRARWPVVGKKLMRFRLISASPDVGGSGRKYRAPSAGLQGALQEILNVCSQVRHNGEIGRSMTSCCVRLSGLLIRLIVGAARGCGGDEIPASA